MDPHVSPIAATCIVILGLLFVFLFMAWCCKQCSQSKDVIAPLLFPHDSFYSPRYMTAVDVQTGLPVIIQTVGGRNSRNLVRIVANDGRHHSINGRGPYATTYGSIAVNTPHPPVDILSRTPPPPYSAVCVQPRV